MSKSTTEASSTKLTAGAVICECLRDEVPTEVIIKRLATEFADEKCGADEKSAKQQIAWYKSQLKRGLRTLTTSDDGVLKVVKLKDDDKRFGTNQLELKVSKKTAPKTRAPKGKKTITKKAASTKSAVKPRRAPKKKTAKSTDDAATVVTAE